MRNLLARFWRWVGVETEFNSPFSLWPDDQAELVEAARNWLASFAHELLREGLAVNETRSEVPDLAIEQFMEAHFPGGWEGFWGYANDQGLVGITDPEDTAELPPNWQNGSRP